MTMLHLTGSPYVPIRRYLLGGDMQTHKTNIEESIIVRLINKIGEHVNKVDKLITHLQRQIPTYVDEKLYTSGQTTLTIQPQSENLQRITTIFCTISAAGGGTITLNDRIIPVPQGNTIFHIGEPGLLLRANDVRQLTQTASGPMGLELIGYETADRGIF